MAPHGVFPARATDTWVAIACATDAHWWALAEWLGRTDLAEMPVADRHARHVELAQLISARTVAHDAGALEAELQRIKIPAHQVQNSAECLADPQLVHRGHYVTVEHPLLGPVVVEGPRFRLSRTPGRVGGAGPTYGQHEQQVLRGLRGDDDARVPSVP
jgi:crotonobetainyl-CoA:carnitine CoA-transferase CaiB-like acyl-CoA transferase